VKGHQRDGGPVGGSGEPGSRGSQEEHFGRSRRESFPREPLIVDERAGRGGGGDREEVALGRRWESGWRAWRKASSVWSSV
jgi:hypothetical protein